MVLWSIAWTGTRAKSPPHWLPAASLSSKASRDYGRPFAEIFKAVNGDFYAIDPMLFSPAKVVVTALETGDSFQSGDIDLDQLDASFA